MIYLIMSITDEAAIDTLIDCRKAVARRVLRNMIL